MTRNRSLHHKCLFCQKERWQTPPSTGLSTHQQMDKEELKCIPTNPTSSRPIGRMHSIHKIRHTLGIQ